MAGKRESPDYLSALFQKQDRFDELKRYQERHNFHIKQLETIMRMLDNDAISLDQVRSISSLLALDLSCCMTKEYKMLI